MRFVGLLYALSALGYFLLLASTLYVTDPFRFGWSNNPPEYFENALNVLCSSRHLHLQRSATAETFCARQPLLLTHSRCLRRCLRIVAFPRLGFVYGAAGNLNSAASISRLSRARITIRSSGLPMSVCAKIVPRRRQPLNSSVRLLGGAVPQSDTKEELIIAPVPALVAVLLRLEQEKGSPLTEAEVIAARDGAACIAMPRHAYEAVTAARGYEDINPELAWEEWQRIKATLVTGEA